MTLNLPLAGFWCPIWVVESWKELLCDPVSNWEGGGHWLGQATDSVSPPPPLIFENFLALQHCSCAKRGAFRVILGPRLPH